MRSSALSIASRYIARIGKIRMYGSLRWKTTAGFHSRSPACSSLGSSGVRWAFQKSTKSFSTSRAARPLTLTCVSRQPVEDHAHLDPLAGPPGEGLHEAATHLVSLPDKRADEDLVLRALDLLEHRSVEPDAVRIELEPGV